MHMQHIYQPAIIATLLNQNGAASSRDIAKLILQQDESQIEYYTYIVDKSHPARVLKKHNVATKNKGVYQLTGFDELTANEIKSLTEICRQKLGAYMDERGSGVWQHRGRTRKAIPVSIRYEVLKRASGRCELCGISKEERVLDVDHIVPHRSGGKSDITNYQALCYKCNTNKRDTDATDFRGLEKMYQHREKDCLFCNPARKILADRTLACAIADSYPVTEGHCLIFPKRHIKSYFELTQGEVNACHQLLNDMREQLTDKDKTITGFNVGVNVGETAGQTIFHCHTHLMPRRLNDVENARGGVRRTIPGKENY